MPYKYFMPRYKLEYPTKSYFESSGPEGVIDELYKTFVGADPIRGDFVKTCAAIACNWTGKPVRFGSDLDFARDLMRYGILEEMPNEEERQKLL